MGRGSRYRLCAKEEGLGKELLATLHFYKVDALYGDSVYSLTRRVSCSKWCPFLRGFVTRSDDFLNSKRRDGLRERVVWIKR